MPFQSDEVLIPTRFFVQNIIPRPYDIDSNFVYNFFTPDEAADDDISVDPKAPSFSSYLNEDSQGNPYKIDPTSGKKLVYVNGKLATDDVLTRISPRFVELSWRQDTSIPVTTEFNESLLEIDQSEMIVREEEISSVYDSSMRMFDPTLRDRITNKLDGLNFILGVAHPTLIKSKVWAAVKKYGAVESELNEDIQDLKDLNAPEDSKRVNDFGKDVPNQKYELASTMMLDFEYDRRVVPSIPLSIGYKNHTFFRHVESYADADSDSRSALPEEPTEGYYLSSQEADLNKNLKLETPLLKAELITSDIVSALVPGPNNEIFRVGYIIERYDAEDEVNLDNPSEIFYLDTPSNTNFIDTTVRYGRAYYYTVRSVYERVFNATAYDSLGNSGGKQRLRMYIASKPSLATYVETRDRIPPNPPDGLFYKFNYNNKKGLMMTWQYPVGRAEDTKYFQIFRRKSIHEPFTCIAEIDFNDAIVKSDKREYVRSSRRIKASGTTTVFQDNEFNRGSSYIYAVGSVDAHGLVSGYSAQTRVTFNRSTNKLDLKRVSRPGAPKQYPNFYVDPDEDEALNLFSLTQDVMTSSGKNKVTIYFDAPAERIRYSDEIGGPSKIEDHVGLRTPGSDEGPVYKMHFINTDRQKDDSIEIRISDFREANL